MNHSGYVTLKVRLILGNRSWYSLVSLCCKIKRELTLKGGSLL